MLYAVATIDRSPKNILLFASNHLMHSHRLQFGARVVGNDLLRLVTYLRKFSDDTIRKGESTEFGLHIAAVDVVEDALDGTLWKNSRTEPVLARLFFCQKNIRRETEFESVNILASYAGGNNCRFEKRPRF